MLLFFFTIGIGFLLCATGIILTWKSPKRKENKKEKKNPKPKQTWTKKEQSEVDLKKWHHGMPCPYCDSEDTKYNGMPGGFVMFYTCDRCNMPWVKPLDRM